MEQNKSERRCLIIVKDLSSPFSLHFMFDTVSGQWFEMSVCSAIPNNSPNWFEWIFDADEYNPVMWFLNLKKKKEKRKEKK